MSNHRTNVAAPDEPVMPPILSDQPPDLTAMPDDAAAETDGGEILRADVATCRAHADRAVAVMIEIMNESSADAATRLRAAIRIVDHAWGKANAESEASDEPSLEDYLAQLGPRETGEPEAFEERAKDLRLIAAPGR